MEEQVHTMAGTNICALIMETKSKYTPGRIAVFEMILTGVMIIALFLPWIRFEAFGESELVYLTEGGIKFVFYLLLFASNIVLKFFKRSRWLSMLLAIIALMLHSEDGAYALNDLHEQSTLPLTNYPAIGEMVIALTGWLLGTVVCCSWIVSLVKRIVDAFRNKRYTKVFSFFLLIFLIVLFAISLCRFYLEGFGHVSSTYEVSQSINNETVENDSYSEEVEEIQYIPFEVNGKVGVKDESGKIIIPAEFDKGTLDIEEHRISAFENDYENFMYYFKKTGVMLRHIDMASGIEVTLLHFADTDTYAFYTAEGQVKADSLSADIFSLRKIDPENGYTVKQYYGFRNNNNDNYMPVYDEHGNRICTFTVNGWQLFGIDHLTRNEDEPRDFDKDFTFTISLEDFKDAHRSVVKN